VKLRLQILLSDLLATAIVFGAVLTVYTTLRQFEQWQLEIALPFHILLATGMLWIACVHATQFKSTRSARLRYLVGLQLAAGIIGILISVSIIESIYGRHRHSIIGAEASQAIADAEEVYYRTDYDKDGVNEYASSLHDLVERLPGAMDLLLIDPGFAAAEGLPATNPTPKAGYCFVILTAQGASAPGRAKSFIDENGNMTGGFAVLAYPAKYDPNANKHKRSCYLIAQDGRMIYMRDFGPQTSQLIPTITTFDPDTNWVPCE